MTNFTNEQKEYLSLNFNKLVLSNQKIDSTSFEDCSFKDCDFRESAILVILLLWVLN